MTTWALQHLAEAGMTDAYLLTSTSEPIARKFGFSSIDRRQAPLEIQASRQFASICPVNAILMHRRLP